MGSELERELSNLVRGFGPLARLEAIHALHTQIDVALDHLEREAALVAFRSDRKVTWEQVGRAVGLSAAAALRKYDPPSKRTRPKPLFE